MRAMWLRMVSTRANRILTEYVGRGKDLEHRRESSARVSFFLPFFLLTSFVSKAERSFNSALCLSEARHLELEDLFDCASFV
jgi:hypothetical protein